MTLNKKEISILHRAIKVYTIELLEDVLGIIETYKLNTNDNG